MTYKYVSSCRGCLANVSRDGCHSFAWPEIKELFEDCTAIKIPPDDRILPQQICSDCLSKCEQWDTFRRMCQEINDHLQNDVFALIEQPLDEDVRNKQDSVPDKNEDDLGQYTFGELVADPEVEGEESSDVTEILGDNCSDMSHNTGSIPDEAPDISKSTDNEDSGKQPEPTEPTPVQHKRNRGKCPVCQKVLLKCNLFTHLVVHTKEHPYLCTYCKKDFRFKQSARAHVHDQHPERPNGRGGVVLKKGSIFKRTRPWEAMGYFLEPTGNFKYRPDSVDNQKTTLIKKQVTPVSRIKCPECKKEMLYQNLVNHFVVHTKESPFLCTYCNADFRFKQCARKHVQVKHPGESTDGVVLKRGSIFKSKRPWEAMGYRVTEDCTGTLDRQQTTGLLQCPDCVDAFQSRYKLLLHSVIHTGEMPYKCTYCPEEFQQKARGIAHVQQKHPREIQDRAIVLKRDTEFGRKLSTLGRDPPVE